MDGILEVLADFGGGAAGGAGIRYLLPAFFWGALAMVSGAHWRSGRDRRDRLILLAALVGLSYELLLFGIAWKSRSGIAAGPGLSLLALAFEHAMQLFTSVMVCYSFIRCILRWNPLPRNVLVPVLGGMAALYLLVGSWWFSRRLAVPDASFDSFPGHLLLHVAATFLLAGLFAAAMSELLWGRRRVPSVLLPAILFLLLDEVLAVAGPVFGVGDPSVIGPVRHNLRLWAIPLFIGVYWRELRHRMEESEKMRTGLFELSPAMLCMADFDGAIRFANPASIRILGLTPGSLLGRRLSEFCRPSEDGDFDLAAIRESPEAVQVEAPHGFPGESTPRWLHWTFRAEPRNRRIFVLATDATVQKRAHDSLLRSEEMLRHSHKMEAVGRLAGGIAHDFNNLLTAILGYCELIGQHRSDTDRILADVGEIRKAAERAAGLTRQLLAFSRRQHLQPKIMDLNETLMAMDSLLHRLIGEDVELVTLPGNDLRKVKADPGQIEQVIVNLVVNARDAMPGGGKILLATRNIEGKGQVALEVRDNGSGMDEETQARVFEPFFTTKEMGKGTGLGLSTVYGIVQQSGGTVRVSSTPGIGTAFIVTLPAIAGGKEVVDSGKSSELSAPLPGKERILLVEDEDSVRDMVCESLQRHGYSVQQAGNGREALSIYGMKPGGFDMVLTDVVMPGMSGGQLAAALRALDPTVKVLFMSGYSDDALVSRGISVHGMDFIGKPFTQDALSRKVRGVLESTAAKPGADEERGLTGVK
ncbi:MAG TPA: ATP-binding protein [Candidatus Deferrimicrobiaceae bacterium]